MLKDLADSKVKGSILYAPLIIKLENSKGSVPDAVSIIGIMTEISCPDTNVDFF